MAIQMELKHENILLQTGATVSSKYAKNTNNYRYIKKGDEHFNKHVFLHQCLNIITKKSMHMQY